MISQCTTVGIVPVDGVETEMIVAKWAGEPNSTSARDRTGEVGRRRSFVGRALLRGVLESLTGIDGREWVFTADDNGKPFARLSHETEGPAVSISHSGDFVAAAATTSGLIGIDIERQRMDRPLAALARYAFGPNECSESKDSHESFYKIWTLREAMAKATGEGLPRAADGLDRVAGAPQTGVWTRKERDGIWRLGHFERVPGYSWAIALRSSARQPMDPWSEDSIAWWTSEMSVS